jgi:hypothetical protein
MLKVHQRGFGTGALSISRIFVLVYLNPLIINNYYLVAISGTTLTSSNLDIRNMAPNGFHDVSLSE